MNFGISVSLMPVSSLCAVSREALKCHVANSMQRYWQHNVNIVIELPVATRSFPEVKGPLRLAFITLPKWAKGCGISGQLAVPMESCPESEVPTWKNVDWWLAAFLLLESWHERTWELNYGPVHSYSARLTGWDDRVWRHAWVNRIALFFRAWVGHLSHQSQDKILGVLPRPEIIVTHDVDAIAKTLPIHLKKQRLFFNAGRAVFSLTIGKEALAHAMRLFSKMTIGGPSIN